MQLEMSILQRDNSHGVELYISPLLRCAGALHAFSTRIGGVSAPPFDTMNLGNPNGCPVQDAAANIRQNYHLLQQATGCADRTLCRVHQVHGNVVVRAIRGQPFDCSTQADGMITDDPSHVLSVRVADCVPILLATADAVAVAAVHAGWRGVIAGVAPRAVEELRRLHGGTQVLAAIGPCIGFDAFEVGVEVLAAFDSAFATDPPTRGAENGKGHVDLREAVRRQLHSVGLHDSQIDISDRCTFRDAGEFFSHRRDRGVTGRMAAMIAPRSDRSA
jgi:YfiH family protein